MNDEVKIIYYQIYLSILLIIGVIVSIILNYNTVLDLENKDTLFNKKQTLRISRYRNFVVLIISILFLYLNYRNKKIAKEKSEDLNAYNLQIIASIFTIIASFIAYYVVLTSSDNETVADIENPII